MTTETLTFNGCTEEDEIALKSSNPGFEIVPFRVGQHYEFNDGPRQIMAVGVNPTSGISLYKISRPGSITPVSAEVASTSRYRIMHYMQRKGYKFTGLLEWDE